MAISAAKPLAVVETKLRQAFFNRWQKMLDAPAGKFGTHPSAAVFPRAIVAGTVRIAHTVNLRHVPPDAAILRLITPLDYSSAFEPTLYSTALYAAPGEVVSVEMPEALVGKLEVQIGYHSDNLNE